MPNHHQPSQQKAAHTLTRPAFPIRMPPSPPTPSTNHRYKSSIKPSFVFRSPKPNQEDRQWFHRSIFPAPFARMPQPPQLSQQTAPATTITTSFFDTAAAPTTASRHNTPTRNPSPKPSFVFRVSCFVFRGSCFVVRVSWFVSYRRHNSCYECT